jgi:hypothetical protein
MDGERAPEALPLAFLLLFGRQGDGGQRWLRDTGSEQGSRYGRSKASLPSLTVSTSGNGSTGTSWLPPRQGLVKLKTTGELTLVSKLLSGKVWAASAQAMPRTR